MVNVILDYAKKGRGAVSNQSGRFEALSVVRIDDGWSSVEGFIDEKLRTTVKDEHP